VIFPPYVAVCVAGATAPDWLEYAISAVVIIICMTVTHLTGSSGFAPFFYDWSGLYQQGLIDAMEWKTNRFRFI
jgi:inner membrane protein